MKYSAEELSKAGDKYLGRSYDEMDCQKFVEKCMADVGYKKDLPGSNAWYRAMDWTGTPEECIKEFGCVPKGAFLFILEHDGKEPEKYRKDGIGNASHIGIKTGRGEGAIHSSHSKGCVCQSKFKDMTIPNGGWNRVGLLKLFDYGNTVNWVLDHGSKPETGGESMDEERTGVVTSENGKDVNMRQKADKKASLVDQIPVGTSVEILGESGDWYKIKAFGKTGYMMKQFVKLSDDDENDLPFADEPEQDEDFSGDDLEEADESEAIALLAKVYDQLGKIRSQIEKVIGKG